MLLSAARDAASEVLVWGDRLGPHLRARFDALPPTPGRRARPRGGYFGRPGRLPVVELPVWAAAAAARAGHPVRPGVIAAAVRSAAMGYLSVRLQDDLLDEGLGAPGPTMLLADALRAEHAAALGAIGGPGVWALYAEVWTAYAEAMLHERALHDGAGVGEAELAAVLRRSHPLALPPAAVFAAAGLDAQLPALRAVVERLALGHQLLHDALTAEQDAARGLPTRAVTRAEGDLATWLHVERGLDGLIDEAAGVLGGAAVAASAIGLDALGSFVDDRIGAARVLADRQGRAHMAALLGG